MSRTREPAAQSPLDDIDRLSALERSDLMDSGAEPVFDRATRLARRVLRAPVSLLSFVDIERQYFKSQSGLEGWAADDGQTPLTHSFCRHVVETENALRIVDARKDARVIGNPAIEELDVIAYLGVPVHAPNGKVLGSFCAIDAEPREWTDDDLLNLQDMVAGLESELRARESATRVEEERVRFRAILDELPIGVAVAEVPTASVTWTNKWGREMLGEELKAENARDYRAFGAIHQDGSRYQVSDYPLVRTAVNGESILGEALIYRRDDARVLDLVVNSRRLPDLGPGHPDLAVATFMDVTDQRQAERTAESIRMRLNHVLEATSDPIIAIDRNGPITYANGAASKLLANGREIVGREIWDAFPEWVGSAFHRAWTRAIENGAPTRSDLQTDKPEAWFDVRIYPTPTDVTTFFRDATIERRAIEARQLLVRELNHRVKNLFAVVSGMISMTARATRTPSEMADALRGRISALARAHELIRPAITMEDARAPDVSLQALIASLIDPHLVHRGDDISISGPAVLLGATGATNIALVLHELATNAAKYGALSSPNGSLDVRWQVVAERLILTWVEKGGPKLDGAPERNGFGSTLMMLSVDRQLRGKLERDFRPEGLKVKIDIALARLQV